MSEHLLTWAGVGEARWEQVRAEVSLGRLRARGTILAGGADPYRADYELVTSAGFVTRRLLIRAAGLGWSRELLLTRDSDGDWTARRTCDPVDAINPLADSAQLSDALADALDCALMGSPLTVAMPVLRHALHRRAGRHELAVAWVLLPDLTVRPATQTYEHLRTCDEPGDDDGPPTPGGAAGGGVVRCASATGDADIRIGPDGFVGCHPTLARRV